MHDAVRKPVVGAQQKQHREKQEGPLLQEAGRYPQGNADIAGGIGVFNLGVTISLMPSTEKKTSTHSKCES